MCTAELFFRSLLMSMLKKQGGQVTLRARFVSSAVFAQVKKCIGISRQKYIFLGMAFIYVAVL